MTKDEATILRLAAEALRGLWPLFAGEPHISRGACNSLADALDRIAGAGEATGARCAVCCEPTTFASRPLCLSCFEKGA